MTSKTGSKQSTNTVWGFIKRYVLALLRQNPATNRKHETSHKNSIDSTFCPQLLLLSSISVWRVNAEGGWKAAKQVLSIWWGELWHSYIPETAQQPQKVGQETADQLLRECLSSLSTQNNWWWLSYWPFNTPLLWQNSSVTIWPWIIVQAVWIIAIC